MKEKRSLILWELREPRWKSAGQSKFWVLLLIRVIDLFPDDILSPENSSSFLETRAIFGRLNWKSMDVAGLLGHAFSSICVFRVPSVTPIITNLLFHPLKWIKYSGTFLPFSSLVISTSRTYKSAQLDVVITDFTTTVDTINYAVDASLGP